MKWQKYSLLMVMSLFLIMACGGEEQPDDKDIINPQVTVKPVSIPSFDAENAYNMVAKQVAFGPRLPNTKEHQATSKWLVEQFNLYGAKVIQQDFIAKRYDGVNLKSKNIIASFNTDNSDRILLCAHWDTRHVADHDPDKSRYNEPILGADDGGSGVGVLLEIARILGQDSSFKHGVDIVLFDSEDHGAPSGTQGGSESWCLGSQHWSKAPHVANYKAKFGILLDMVGSKSPRFTKEGTSMQYAPTVMNKVWDIASSLGYGAFFDPTTTSAITDDHYFVNTLIGIPTIDIINKDLSTQSNFGQHWHTHKDNMDVIGKGTLKAVGQVVLTVLYKED